MAVTDDAFELIRDLDALRRLAKDSGNTELKALAVSISDRAGQLSRRLTELLEEREVLDTENKKYKLAGSQASAKTPHRTAVGNIVSVFGPGTP